MDRVAFNSGSQVMSRPARSVVAVSPDVQMGELLDALSFDTNDFDVVYVEPIEWAYSRIKQVAPDAVIVLAEMDDVAACQLLSMMKVDADLSNVLVVTCPARRAGFTRERTASALPGASPRLEHTIWMN